MITLPVTSDLTSESTTMRCLLLHWVPASIPFHTLQVHPYSRFKANSITALAICGLLIDVHQNSYRSTLPTAPWQSKLAIAMVI